MSNYEQQKFSFTDKQGQYLAFIYQYTKLNGIPPAHTDLQKYFEVTPPSVNQMINTLEKKGLISKKPRKARSLSLLFPSEQLPVLK
ncbi:LexA family protein [Shewanella surugensis]|uniref:MarR family transcriptional regulator n=1 Tax=Shewanella surugensis TaxID=212020 RepID=A0ABT0L7K3_9GAMM|nr:MarR family transcriptional regulator [Shewanella surugensis]MCL1123667.1 MarR family transcriptional regulator [Shewanella surugensis]